MNAERQQHTNVLLQKLALLNPKEIDNFAVVIIENIKAGVRDPSQQPHQIRLSEDNLNQFKPLFRGERYGIIFHWSQELIPYQKNGNYYLVFLPISLVNLFKNMKTSKDGALNTDQPATV